MQTTLALALFLAGSIVAQERVPDALREVLDAPAWRGADFGLLAVDLGSGEVVVERASERRFAPASVTKLFSGAAALVTLGAGHVFETKVHAVGGVDEDGNVGGLLVLRAAGDPNLSGRRQSDGTLAFTNGDHTYAGFSDASVRHGVDPLEGLDDLATLVKASGVNHVRDVAVDDRLFERAAGTGSGPGTLTPIVVNDNVLDILVHPATKAGEPARCEVRPAPAWIRVDARVETVAEDVGTQVWVEREGAWWYSVRGRIAVGRAPLLRVTEVDDAEAFARGLFLDRLAARGVSCPATPGAGNPSGELPAADVVARAPVVGVHTSPPLTETLKVILKVSHNLHAGMLPLLLAGKHGERTLDAGLRREGEALAALGVPLDTITFGSAAGGGWADQVTPAATVALLTAMAKRKDFGAYRDALPSLGVDGTLHDMVAPGSRARGQVHAKTGTLIWSSPVNGKHLLRSKALAGYIDTEHGRLLAFAFFLNDAIVAQPADAAVAGRALARMCEILHAGY